MGDFFMGFLAVNSGRATRLADHMAPPSLPVSPFIGFYSAFLANSESVTRDFSYLSCLTITDHQSIKIQTIPSVS